MTPPVEPITDLDIHAYVDDQLATSRRMEVEAQLSRDPILAARVFSDFRVRRDLRIVLSDTPWVTRASTAEAAHQLERQLTRDRFPRSIRFWHLRHIAAVAMFVAVGWIAHDQMDGLTISKVVASPMIPAYVEDAVMAYQTILVRATMRSQHAEPKYDPEEIRAAARIVMPTLPKDWKVDDVQMFPSKFGPSVEMTIRTGELGMMTLFAVRLGSFKVIPVTVADKADVTVAYWQVGEIAYALSAKSEARKLNQAASGLVKTLY